MYVHYISAPGRKQLGPNLTLLNAELNPIRHLLALVGDRHIVHDSRIRVSVQLGNLAEETEEKT